MALIRVAMLFVPTCDEDIAGMMRSTLSDDVENAFYMPSSVVPDQRNRVAETVRRWCDEEEVDLLLTIGGISVAPGTSGDESVPLAMDDMLERELPGLAEAMRTYAQEEYPLALLQNAKAGIRGRTLVVNLPAEAEMATLFLEAVVDLIEPTVLHLRDRFAEGPLALGRSNIGPEAALTSDGSEDQGSTLDIDEFKAFLAQKKTDKP